MVFNQEMLVAIVNGQKTVTRQPVNCVVKHSEESGFNFEDNDGTWWACGKGFNDNQTENNFVKLKSPVQVDDVIIVQGSAYHHGATDRHGRGGSLSPLIPRPDSELMLKVKKIGVEKAQDITDEQAIKEGCNGALYIRDSLGNLTPPKGHSMTSSHPTPRHWFACLWESMHKNWSENPFVWVIEFELVEGNINVNSVSA